MKDKVDEYLKDYKVSKATRAKIYGEWILGQVPDYLKEEYQIIKVEYYE
jgi:hypothetical protein